MPFECGTENAGVVDRVGRQLGVWHYGSPESARTLKMWETGFHWRRACVGSSECATLQHGGYLSADSTGRLYSLVSVGPPVPLASVDVLNPAHTAWPGPTEAKSTRLRAPCLRSAVEPQAQGCPRPRRVEGPGTAPWPVSAIPRLVASPGPVSGPRSEAVSSDQAPV